MYQDIISLNEKIARENGLVHDLIAEIGKVIIGQQTMIERLLIGLFTDGHILLEGVPGLAKTLTVSTLASAINAEFSRIQFTPDLLPADLVGTLIFNQKTGEFIPKKGPVFTNFVLADEINRAPAKVQSALLECMQEHQVTISDTTYPMKDPFLVLATQNPIEQEGTYPLPEAQLDRFMLKIRVGYPTIEEEKSIIERNGTIDPADIEPVIGPEDIFAARSTIEKIRVEEKILDYILALVFASRDSEKAGLKDIAPMIQYGASPRASLYLTAAAKAHAFIRGRWFVNVDDVKLIAHDVLRHRILVSYEAEAENKTSDDIIDRILGGIEAP